MAKASTPTPKFQNGDIVKDAVTGYEGMIVATILWLNGCYRYIVQAQKLNKDTGKPYDDIQIDEMQLSLVAAEQFEGTHDTGGPRPRVSQRTV